MSLIENTLSLTWFLIWGLLNLIFIRVKFVNEETDNQWSTVNTLERRDFRISIKWLKLRKSTISEKKKGF